MKSFLSLLVLLFLIVGLSRTVLAETPEEIEALRVESEAKSNADAQNIPTPEVIKATVDKACKMLMTEGVAVGFRKFKGKDSEYLFGGTYVWIHDMNGKMIVHPIKPKMEGKEMLGLQDVLGNQIFVGMNKLVEDKVAGCLAEAGRTREFS